MPLAASGLLTFVLGVFAVLAGPQSAARAGSLLPGDELAAFTLEDQHGKARSVDESVRVLLFSRDMGGGKFLREAVEDRAPGWMEEHGIAYVADISGMPRLIASLFALPRMRRRPYPMLLDRDGSVTTRLPDEEGRATLIFLISLKVERIEHLDSTKAVREALDGLAAAPADEPSEAPSEASPGG